MPDYIKRGPFTNDTDPPIDADTANYWDDAHDAANAAIDDHANDSTNAHAASAISYTPAASIAATNVQGAIEEVVSDLTTTITNLPPQGLVSIDGVSNAGGDVDLVAGSNVTITPNDGANTITIASTASVGSSVAAADVTYAGSTNLSSTNVEAALDELDTEKASDASLTAHINDTSAAHAASAVSYAGASGISSTDVEGAIDELAAEKADTGLITAHTTETVGAHAATAISYAGGTGISATTVEGAIDELATEKLDAATMYYYYPMVFANEGVQTVFTGAFRQPVMATGTIIKVFATVSTAPTGASLIVDLNKNGTSVWATTQSNRLTVAISGTSATQTAFDTTSVTEGDYLTMDVDQIGSTVAGTNLVVVVKIRAVI